MRKIKINLKYFLAYWFICYVLNKYNIVKQNKNLQIISIIQDMKKAIKTNKFTYQSLFWALLTLYFIIVNY